MSTQPGRALGLEARLRLATIPSTASRRTSPRADRGRSLLRVREGASDGRPRLLARLVNLAGRRADFLHGGLGFPDDCPHLLPSRRRLPDCGAHLAPGVTVRTAGLWIDAFSA